ncbi:hypothetical protein SERLA73DRAFT_186807 [Serpula lacrymans var. lacrymans S7.3]|uniref:Mnn4-regulates the mannosylphosphorylation n=2 Tax=Serpula lacrymans var. lacrymans TaxID=341189 RepID=F8Q7X0_SERL3|nr:uncharacterized protein SERLADRAFT_476047 [Serpula lacrymans var. lacrymans S7.9]EGN95658.1 hypothetical protein SERLA73DRAFT_186807 [Serpula lacrymans var. lacrymans S7.3]EGO21184.1 hypothetical protein SERLADRAFT_476047 [Serpula lacrymans var. lacrymans S7.9]
MNSLLGPLGRSAALRRAPLALRRPSPPLSSLTLSTRPTQKRPIPLAAVHARFVASSVSGRPGSQTIGHAKQNVKEEVGNSAADWARSIAGGIFALDSVKPSKESFYAITSAVATSVPAPYLVMGLAGGLPYVASAGTTVYLAHQAGLAAMGTVTNMDPGVALTILDQALTFQVTYGAVMLSFLGALHWGMEFAGQGGHKGYPRLLLGVTPAVVAWSTIALQPTSALICQWIGFTALWYVDNRATSAGWTPKWYSQYRFYLSILVGTCIIGSLAGTSYWGPVAGHGLLSHDLERIRSIRKESQPERAGFIGGDIEAVAGDEKSDSYVVIRKKEKKQEEGESREQ